MSIYGCPEQEINKWSHAYINVTMGNDNRGLVRSINEEVRLWKEPDFLLLGPYGKRFIQMNFCSKTSQPGKLKGGEWPHGVYAVYSNDGESCPDGRFRNDTSHVVNILNLTPW